MKRISFPDRVPITVNLAGFIMVSVFEMNSEELEVHPIYRGISRPGTHRWDYFLSFHQKAVFLAGSFRVFDSSTGPHEGYSCGVPRVVIS